MAIGRGTRLIGQVPAHPGVMLSGNYKLLQSLGSKTEPKDGFIEGQSTHV